MALQVYFPPPDRQHLNLNSTISLCNDNVSFRVLQILYAPIYYNEIYKAPVYFYKTPTT